VKRVGELLGLHRGAIGDLMEIDGHFAALSLEALGGLYDQKIADGEQDPFTEKGQDKEQQEKCAASPLRLGAGAIPSISSTATRIRW
jgi:hypothetical protein